MYVKPDRSDTLVTYDEFHEKNGDTRRRAFFLFANLRQIENGKKPRFVDFKSIDEQKLLPVAERSMTNNALAGTFLVNHGPLEKTFGIVWAGQEMGPYGLPTYPEISSQNRRVLLTPLAVTGDVVAAAVLVGSVAGIYVIYAYCSGNSSTGR